MSRKAFLLPLAAIAASCQQPAIATERGVEAPIAVRQANEPAGLKYAIFAGGCFWGVEGVFSHVQGVTGAVSGFHGGAARDATYEKLRGGGTNHAEAVRVTYDPARIRYDQLVRIFFSVITDPTQLNRQGPDVGTQYRSALVPLSAEQRAVATAYLGQLRAARLWPNPIVTRIEPHRGFYPADAYHQDFMRKNPRHPYIVAWDVQKVRNLQRLFPAQYKAGFTPG